MGRRPIPFEERFFARVNKDTETGCWNWTGSHGLHWRTHEPTYGQTTYEGIRMGAHRAAYLHFIGSIPEGLDVLHDCDNPSCVRPSHLRLGTHTDNMREKFAKGRGKIYKGSANNKSKLTEDQVREIKQLRGQYTQRQLGEMFNISSTVVGNILRGKVWRHVE